MDVIQRVQQTIDYIEEHVTSEITLEELAQIACYSAFHFHRLFQVTVGVSVMTYLKRRRLDCAAQELVRSERKILDIALEYGFGSHETFTRAFKRTFQTTPGEYRKAGHYLPLFRPANVLNPAYQHIGGIHMTPNIISRPASKVLGYTIRTSIIDERNHEEIPAFWQRYISEGLGKNIPDELKLNPGVELGICLAFDPQTNELTYMIGCEVPEDTEFSHPDLTLGTIPAATYAVFTTPTVADEMFPKTIQDTWSAAFRDWFPESGYQHAGTPEMEWYDERSANPAEMQMDIYIPIKQR